MWTHMLGAQGNCRPVNNGSLSAWLRLAACRRGMAWEAVIAEKVCPPSCSCRFSSSFGQTLGLLLSAVFVHFLLLGCIAATLSW